MKNIATTQPTLVQAIEDNAGTLYVAIHRGEKTTHLFSTDRPDAWGAPMRDIIEAAGQPDGASAWDGDADDPQAAYDQLTSYQYGWKIVADWSPEGGYDEYPNAMGANAREWAGR